MTDDALLIGLRQRVHEAVRAVTPFGPVALLDFPDYANPGDSAIWLGTLACLSSLGFPRPVYVSDIRTFDERALRRALPSGTILLSGGGNLGDLWPRHQVFRERIVRSFHDHAIVQLPQSIHFENAAGLGAAKRIFADHPRFSLLVRDQPSWELASEFGCRTVLCPDMAVCVSRVGPLALTPNERSGSGGVLWLMRRDHESQGGSVPATARVVDWAEAPWSSLDRIASRLRTFTAKAGANELMSWGSRRVLSTMSTTLARRNVLRAYRLLRSARVVVTDRLHGHILALLLGVRHIVVGDRYGKLRAFIDTWTAESSLIHWADSTDDAAALAESLMSDGVREPA